MPAARWSIRPIWAGSRATKAWPSPSTPAATPRHRRDVVGEFPGDGLLHVRGDHPGVSDRAESDGHRARRLARRPDRPARHDRSRSREPQRQRRDRPRPHRQHLHFRLGDSMRRRGLRGEYRRLRRVAGLDGDEHDHAVRRRHRRRFRPRRGRGRRRQRVSGRGHHLRRLSGDGVRRANHLRWGDRRVRRRDHPARPERGGGGGGSTCFIATAAFGSPMAREVGVLREFRDDVLLPHAAGRAAVAAYYQIGPAFARVIARSETLKAVVRTGLAPMDLAGVALSRPRRSHVLPGGRRRERPGRAPCRRRGRAPRAPRSAAAPSPRRS